MAFKHRYLGPLLWGREDNDINCMYFCILFLLISEDSTAYLWMRGTRSIFNIFSKFQRDNAQSRLNFIKSISLFWFEDIFAKRASTPYPIRIVSHHHLTVVVVCTVNSMICADTSTHNIHPSYIPVDLRHFQLILTDSHYSRCRKTTPVCI